MFESYYKLDANPFRLSADEQFRFAHKNYLKVWSYLKYALEQGEGFVMVTGSPGCGKTTLIRDILAQVDKSKILAINLVTNQLQAEELLRKVALEFGLNAESYSKAMLLTSIQEFVTKEYRSGRRAVIVIDEAQNLTLTGLEELRLLSNLQTESHPLFQIFLVGQDELRSLILSSGMEQVRQRMIASCQIESMDLSQTQGYIEHRLGIVGWNQDPVFDDVIFPLIHYLSGGIPRKINHIVSRLLLYGALEEKHEFTQEDVWIVAKELFDEERLSFEGGDSFTSFKEKFEQIGHDSSVDEEISHMEEVAAQPQVDVDEADEMVKSDTDFFQEHQDEAGLISEPVKQEEIEPKTAGAEEKWEDTPEIDSESEFYPYGKSQLDSDTTPLTEEGSPVDESPEDEDFKDDTVRLTGPKPGVKAPVETGKAYIDESEFINLTTKILREGQIRIEEATTETRDANPEDILNLPSMQAEKRKHEIDEKGGFINTAETSEVDDLLTGTLSRSLRNIFLIVLTSIFLVLLFVVRPERIDQLWQDTVAKLQSMLDPAEEGYQVIPPTTDIQVQIPSEKKLPQVDVTSTTDTQPPRLPVEKQEKQVAQDDEIETNEAPAEPIVTQPDREREEKVTALQEVPTDPDEVSQEAKIEGERQNETPTSEDMPVLGSEEDLVQRASKDYIATQSKYQKVEIGAEDEEVSLAVPGMRKFQIYFEFDNPNIPLQFKEMLNDLYIVLSLNRAATMTITGYTDASGDPAYNLNLSLARANAVSSYFTERGINQDRILVEGRGPLPKSTTTQHEALEKRFGNRRVEIVLSETGE
jgi:type II secretory pathway predicted ATPase ExeA/outer membrane protein OmpA-like peptidoglycan-associated protein